ncbi:MAG: DUF4129 domain-containing protein [Terracidiphilus sp.]
MWTRAALAALLSCAPVLAIAQIPAAPIAASGGVLDVSMADYRAHLQALSEIVAACAKARDATACDPELAGPNDRVPLPGGAKAQRRLINYDWLRALLNKAQLKDNANAAPHSAAAAKTAPALASVLPPPPTTTELLKAAQTRLAHDLAQAGGAPPSQPNHSAQRAAMNQVLAEREFRSLEEQPSLRQTALEKFGNWLNSLFAIAARFGARAAWLGHLVQWGFILAVCVGLVWGLLQIERRWRIRLVPESVRPAPDAPSARDWQLWLEDARKAAAAGAWREAIHFVYWAAVSRLESRRLWPADRARTPREYVALIAGDDPRKDGLAALTGSFERTWYGGRPAPETEYKRAEELASALISGGATANAGGGATR